MSDVVDAFAGWHPAVTEMVGATNVGARWALHDLKPLHRWHTDRVVLIADAAERWCPIKDCPPPRVPEYVATRGAAANRSCVISAERDLAASWRPERRSEQTT